MNNQVEMRWFCEYTPPSSKAMRRKIMRLQYREFMDVGGPYPVYRWTEWKDVPEHWESEETNDAGEEST